MLCDQQNEYQQLLGYWIRTTTKNCNNIYIYNFGWAITPHSHIERLLEGVQPKLEKINKMLDSLVKFPSCKAYRLLKFRNLLISVNRNFQMLKFKECET
jgi:hypothetical protein